MSRYKRMYFAGLSLYLNAEHLEGDVSNRSLKCLSQTGDDTTGSRLPSPGANAAIIAIDSSKPKLKKNWNPDFQTTVSRFSNYGLFQAESRKMI